MFQSILNQVSDSTGIDINNTASMAANSFNSVYARLGEGVSSIVADSTPSSSPSLSTTDRIAKSLSEAKDASIDIESQKKSKSSSSWFQSISDSIFNHVHPQQQQEQQSLPGNWLSAYLPSSQDFAISRSQRFIGFLSCLGLGIFCLLLSTMYLPTILFTGRKFAFLYTVANLLMAGSTMFLMGPLQQFQTMFQANRQRLVPSCVFCLSSILTLVAAIQLHNVFIVMFLIIVQGVSVFWYILTFIPFAQSMLSVLWTSLRTLF